MSEGAFHGHVPSAVPGRTIISEVSFLSFFGGRCWVILEMLMMRYLWRVCSPVCGGYLGGRIPHSPFENMILSVCRGPQQATTRHQHAEAYLFVAPSRHYHWSCYFLGLRALLSYS